MWLILHLELLFYKNLNSGLLRTALELVIIMWTGKKIKIYPGTSSSTMQISVVEKEERDKDKGSRVGESDT